MIPLRALIPTTLVIVAAVLGPLLPDHHPRTDPCAGLPSDAAQFICWLDQQHG